MLELPQETSETAETMRRVVSDQIRALKELAALVTDSGVDFDVVEPASVDRGGRRARYPQPRCADRREAARHREPASAGRPGAGSGRADRHGGVRDDVAPPPPARQPQSSTGGRPPARGGAAASTQRRRGSDGAARLAFEPARGRFARRARRSRPKAPIRSRR